MKSLIRWAVRNSPGMNALMIGILVLGGYSFVKMRREVFPQFDLEIILVTVAYPNAPPDEVEEGICQRVEEKVRAINGIKKVTSVAKEGAGNVVIELKSDVGDVERVKAEIQSAVDQAEPFFPENHEKPIVQQITFRRNAIRVAVLGPGNWWKNRTDLSGNAKKELEAQSRLQLRLVTEEVLGKLLKLDGISEATIIGAQPFQIDVSVRENVLKKYPGLTHELIASAVRRANRDLAAGKIKLPGEEVLLRGKNKTVLVEKIEQIPIITKNDTDGNQVVQIPLSEIAEVRLGLDDSTSSVSYVNGKPGLVIQVDSASNEDLIQATKQVHQFVSDGDVPQDYSMVVWGDVSIDVQDRLDMLMKNGLQGLLLVFLVLAIFLELKLAFWVALGIPISIFGAGMILFGTGETLNMLSMFAFLMALGIVVDDAIVIGENVYAHRQMGKSFSNAAVNGAYEVFPSVFASVATTMIAFAPMLFVVGVMGKFIGVLPVAIIAMLAISLIESVLILPGHLAHRKTMFDVAAAAFFYPFRFLLVLFNRVNASAKAGLDWFVTHTYVPTIRFALRRPSIIISFAVMLMIVAAALVRSGIVPFIFFPKLDTREIQATVIFPDGTTGDKARAATKLIEAKMQELNTELEREHGKGVVRLMHRTVGTATMNGPRGIESTGGSHVGSVVVELTNPEARSITSQEIVRRWREKTGDIAGTETLTFASRSFGPGGKSIEMKLLADKKHFDELKRAVKDAKARLKRYPGVFDEDDDSRKGKAELQIQATPFAKRRDIKEMDLANQVRDAYYGREVDRLQMGRNEVKLMVRYPEDQRSTWATLEDETYTHRNGVKQPIANLIRFEQGTGYSEINRIDQQRSITVTADVDEARGNASQIVAAFKKEDVDAILKKYPNVSLRWEGQQEQQRESIESLIRGLAVALLAMMMLLMLQFRSWLQPLIIFAVIPFGAIGALFGHLIMGLPLTLFSLFGLVAMTGVVVNDSIVLIDFINARVRSGIPLKEALVEAGQRRFRPVLLTSVTTIAGLLPILAESSFQAQILIPMATSLCFGLLVATVLVVLLVPTLYYLYYRATAAMENALLDHEDDDVDFHDEG